MDRCVYCQIVLVQGCRIIFVNLSLIQMGLCAMVYLLKSRNLPLLTKHLMMKIGGLLGC
jgi:hypothetical protein